MWFMGLFKTEFLTSNVYVTSQEALQQAEKENSKEVKYCCDWSIYMTKRCFQPHAWIHIEFLLLLIELIVGLEAQIANQSFLIFSHRNRDERVFMMSALYLLDLCYLSCARVLSLLSLIDNLLLLYIMLLPSIRESC